MDWPNIVRLIVWLTFSGFVLAIFRHQLRGLLQELINLTRRVNNIRIKRSTSQIEIETIPREVKIRLEQDGMARLTRILQNAGIDASRFPIEFLLPEFSANDRRWPEKVALGFYVCHHLLQRTRGIILDTGSTVAAISAVLMNRATKPEIVITNSLSTASFICRSRSPSKQPQILVPGGIVRSDFRGCYWDSDDIKNRKLKGGITSQIEDLLKDFQRSLESLTCIISATDFSAQDGPGANSPENRLWKKQACLLADRVIICLDVDKIEHARNGIFGATQEWEDLLGAKDVSIVLCGQPRDTMTAIVNAELQIIHQLEERMKKTLLHHGLEVNGRWEFKHRSIKNGLFADEVTHLEFGP